MAGEQIEAASHQPTAEQGNDGAGGGAEQAGRQYAPPQRMRATASEPGTQSDGAAEQHTLERPGDVAGRLTQQQAEGIEPQQLDDGAHDQPAQGAPGDAPALRPVRAEACRGNPECDAGCPDQGHQYGEADNDEQDRYGAHARLQRL
jgi:hypothetical protein